MLQRASDYPIRKDSVDAALPGGDQRVYSVDPRELATILRRRWWVVTVTTLALLIPSILFVLIATPRYTAISTVFVDPHRSSVVDTNNGQSVSATFATDDSIVNSQVSLIQSVAVLQRVVTGLNLAHDPEFGPHSSILDPIK